MEWVKLSTNYYLDPAIMRAGEQAEVLFTRALAYVGDHENDGVVPKEALQRLTPLRGASRARSLVREGLWEVIPGGWRFVNWSKHQKTKEQMAATRESARSRQARHRRNAVTDGVTNAVSDGGVTRTEVEVEVDAAAAASATRSGDLPPAVAILRSALDARKLTARWDTLTTEQLTEIEALIETHGDGVLVKDALRAFQPNKPAVFATAWLGGWRVLRVPGDLRVVSDPCPEPGHSGTTKHCVQCASEQKAATR